MSITVDIVDPCAKNLSKLLHAIADYIDVTQKMNLQLTAKFVKDDTK